MPGVLADLTGEWLIRLPLGHPEDVNIWVKVDGSNPSLAILYHINTI